MRFWLENLKKSNHLEEIGAYVRINIKMDVWENKSEYVNCLQVDCDRVGSWTCLWPSGFIKAWISWPSNTVTQYHGVFSKHIWFDHYVYTIISLLKFQWGS
jgi:hypothetical protein